MGARPLHLRAEPSTHRMRAHSGRAGAGHGGDPSRLRLARRRRQRTPGFPNPLPPQRAAARRSYGPGAELHGTPGPYGSTASTTESDMT